MTCSVFNCCARQRAGIQEISRNDIANKQRDQLVLLLASSDVLHSIRSPYVNVILIDTRNTEQYRHSHIQGAVHFPYEDPDAADVLLKQDRNLQEILARVTAGQLEKGISAKNPTSPAGTCIIIYDSIGDTMRTMGPAAMLAEKLVEQKLIPEVGRLAGGFQAFLEMRDCLYFNADERPSSGKSNISRDSTLSRAMTPRSSGVHQSVFSEPVPSKSHNSLSGSMSGSRLTPRWKVTIDTPMDVPPAEILEGRLYLGNKNHATNRSLLRSLGITHIVNVSRNGTTPWDDIDYCMCHVADTIQSDISQFFDLTYKFIDSALNQRPNTTVLVHCAEGVSRSSAIVLSYIMRKENITLAQALQLLRSKHPAAAPNSGFIHQLMKLERRCGLSEPSPLVLDLAACEGVSKENDASAGFGGGVRRCSWVDYAAAPPTPQSEHVSNKRAPAWTVSPNVTPKHANMQGMPPLGVAAGTPKQ